MSTDCCSDSKCDVGPAADGCSGCGRATRAVGLVTLKALFNSNALKRIEQGPYKFCANPTCDTVYTGPDGSVFTTSDLAIPVWQKANDPGVFVCYCFEHSETSMREEFLRNGEIGSVREIRELIARKKCACEVRNPQGACCLGNVMEVEANIRNKRSG